MASYIICVIFVLVDGYYVILGAYSGSGCQRRDVHTLRLVMLSKPEYNHNLTVIQRYEKKNSAQLTVVTEHFKTSRKMHML